MAEPTQSTKPLTIREKLAIAILLVIFEVVKPFDWEHKTTAALKEIRDLINSEK